MSEEVEIVGSEEEEEEEEGKIFELQKYPSPHLYNFQFANYPPHVYINFLWTIVSFAHIRAILILIFVGRFPKDYVSIAGDRWPQTLQTA